MKEENDTHVSIAFPRCLGKGLDEYPKFPEWEKAYKELKARGEVIVRDNLGMMVEQIFSTGEWESCAGSLPQGAKKLPVPKEVLDSQRKPGKLYKRLDGKNRT